MMMKARMTTLAALTLLGASLVTGTPATIAAAPTTTTGQAMPGGPSNQEIMDAFRSEWGTTAVAPSGISDWQPFATWGRAAQYAFAPGADEFTGTPKLETGLASLSLVIVSRQDHHQTQYQVRETANRPGDTPILNYFPIFSGTPHAMTFYNAAGIPGLPAGEIQQTCRDLTFSGRHFLVCRMIASDHSIHYQIKVPAGTSVEGLPAIDPVMHAFRDLWGKTTFTPTGATAWKPISQWQRFYGFSFKEGDTETHHGAPVDQGTFIPLTLEMMTRTVGGKRQFTERGLAAPQPDVTREDGFVFDRFAGGPSNWFIHDDGSPTTGGEYLEHRKIATINGQTLLVDRTLIPQSDGGHSITYYILAPTNQ